MDVQFVSYVFIYLSVGNFSRLFNQVFISSFYLVFCFLFIYDDFINVNEQLVSYVFSYLSVGMFSRLFNWVFILSFYFVFCSLYINDTVMMSLMWMCSS